MIPRWLIASASIWLSAQAVAADPFAIAVRIRDDGPVRTLPLAGARPVRFRAVRYEPKSGASDWAAQFHCGIILEVPGKASTRIETIGSGETEALSCDGLAEAGMAARKGQATLIVLVYRTRSPNATGRTPIIVRKGKGAASWTLDVPLSAQLSTKLGTPSLASIRRALAH